MEDVKFEGPVAKNLWRRHARPEWVIIFGSRISGSPRKDSDLDAVLLANSFDNIPFLR